MKKRALVIMHEGVEEMEAITPIDVLRRGGIEVITASTNNKQQITGRNNITFLVDSPLSQVAQKEYNCVILPGGPGIIRSVRNDEQVKTILKRQFNTGKWVAGICAAPLVFKDIGILNNKQYTAHPSTANELPHIIADKRVVVHDNVITSARCWHRYSIRLEKS